MGLFDAIRDIGVGVLQQELGGQPNAMGNALRSVLDNNGGLAGLLDRFRQSGLGGHADSWVGTGANLPLDAQQIVSALGSDQVAALARDLGIDTRQMASHLAQVLPGFIDHLTPGGQLPASGSVSQALEALLRR
jgi:uncharacterized protein YidB (DUF937 family)